MSESTKGSISARTSVEQSAITGSASSHQTAGHHNQPFELNAEEVKRFINLYASNPLFRNAHEQVINDNPYRRPIDPDLVTSLDFSKPLTRDDVFSRSALAAHRMLLNIYEGDLVFLPESDFGAKKGDFSLFYSDECRLMGEMVRPTLESHVFGFLHDSIDVTGKWTAEALRSYMQALLKQHEQSQLDVVRFILASKEPEKAALALLIQVASDFLTEASASARNVLGKFGPIQSELFKIVIDDYGYGVHKAKHSTLFEDTLASCGLTSHAHAYWQFYLSSSLALANYYHFVSRNHNKFFRYVGAFAFAEAMFSHTCGQISEMLRKVFGSGVETYYFDEHYHIDAHHGRMAFDNLVEPAIAKYGDAVIEEIVRGLEEVRLLSVMADEDFIAQASWFDQAEAYKSMAQSLQERVLGGDVTRYKPVRLERQAEPQIMQAADEDELWVVETGALDIMAGYGQLIRLGTGESLMVPRHRLRTPATTPGECVYQIYKIGDHKAWLS